ncbi:ABC transporter ATP-binding protein [Gulosibacter chungangensis]|uniref:ABC transporter ATP-binding protein n=1 Tax=Gulosibacter chungangensis TaxID=979746 RepID=A0A7J5BFT5_9MICO|nr:ABC transporter ATP-binding protein [Gulosibacter chungangensis]KAB1645143.1 ABC transporter ATP-binding protein [Gulosibacter chungangensis]
MSENHTTTARRSRTRARTADETYTIPVGEGLEPVLRIESLYKHFQLPGEKKVTAVDGIDLTVNRGEFLVLLGPSGCGKTTLLRCVAGLDQPDSGRIKISGQDVYRSEQGLNLPPEKRHISMIFQTYALWPHMTAAQNVAYPLISRGMKAKEAKERVERVLEQVDVSSQAKRYPNQMSGGQQQRVALARALVAGTDLILFDEPLSNIDAKVREQLREEMLEMQRTIGFTALYVTHDQSEAMHLAHRIAVLDNGKISQLDTGRAIYTRPENRYVARFIGRTNETKATVEADGVVATPFGRGHAEFSGGEIPLGQEASVAWRPENATVTRVTEPAGERAALTVEGVVAARVFVGMNVELLVSVGDETLLAIAPPDSDIIEGEQVRISVKERNLLALPTGA